MCGGRRVRAGGRATELRGTGRGRGRVRGDREPFDGRRCGANARRSCRRETAAARSGTFRGVCTTTARSRGRRPVPEFARTGTATIAAASSSRPARRCSSRRTRSPMRWAPGCPTHAVSYVAWLTILDGLPMLFAAAALRRAALGRHLAVRAWKSVAGGALQLTAYGLVVWALSLRADGRGVGVARDECPVRGRDRGEAFWASRWGRAGFSPRSWSRRGSS